LCPQHLTVASSCDELQVTNPTDPRLPPAHCLCPLPPLRLSLVYRVGICLSHIGLSSSLTPRLLPPQGPSTPFHCPLYRSKCLLDQPGPKSRVLPPASYQQRAREKFACGDQNSRPPIPQIDRSKALPQLCGRAARSDTNPISPLYRHNRGWVRWTPTVAGVAAA